MVRLGIFLHKIESRGSCSPRSRVTRRHDDCNGSSFRPGDLQHTSDRVQLFRQVNMAADSPARGDPRESGAAWSALRGLRLPLLIALLATVYFWAAKLGLSMGVTPRVTTVWPPTGIALAALLLFGYRIWPGIALGAFLANVTAPLETPGTAAGIALGNTLEALAGAWLVMRWPDFDCSLGRLRDVLSFILLAAGLSTTISATIGVLSLWLGGD